MKPIIEPERPLGRALRQRHSAADASLIGSMTPGLARPLYPLTGAAARDRWQRRHHDRLIVAAHSVANNVVDDASSQQRIAGKVIVGRITQGSRPQANTTIGLDIAVSGAFTPHG